MFRKVFIANRGEIAVRIARTLREMGIASAAGYSDADRDALFVEVVDEAYHLGPDAPAESYLNAANILSAARQSRADALHPGYGFLSENAAFAEAVEAAGFTFIGPSPHSIRLMGDKVAVRCAVASLGVPVVPGSEGPVETLQDALDFADKTGYPVAVKAAAGGGGRGIRIVGAPPDMADALERAQREAQAYFGNPQVYLERYFSDPRHVEVQVLGDRLGNLVQLGERDCSIQRRHQKLIEETPSPAVDKELRERMGEMALRAARATEYSSAGTVEFLLSREGDFYFLEMNTRIQVEHPVTEAVTGIDLIREMVLAAAGEPISPRIEGLEAHGHAIEVRINAEDPSHGFRPTPATIRRYRVPGGMGVRVDSGVREGYTIPQSYDSLIAKLVVWAPDREQARLRSLRALGEFVVSGPATTITFLEGVLNHPVFAAGEAGTAFVDDHLAELPSGAGREQLLLEPDISLAQEEPRTFQIEVNRKLFRVAVFGRREDLAPRARQQRPSRSAGNESGSALLSPMHGTVIAVRKQPGESVQEGEPLFIVEAMKMENEVPAHRGGTLASVDVQLGQTVEAGQSMGSIV